MTDEELAAIRERVEVATPGPWEYDDQSLPSIYILSGADTIAAVWRSDSGDSNGQPNAKFIAHARDDVPTLLAELDRLREWEEKSRPIVEAMAYLQPIRERGAFGDWCGVCYAYLPDQEVGGDLTKQIEHASDCPMIQARALMAEEQGR
jgi:hypothetical protein